MDLSDVLFTEAEPTRTGDVKQTARRLRQQGLGFEEIGDRLDVTAWTAYALVTGKGAKQVAAWRRKHFPPLGE